MERERGRGRERERERERECGRERESTMSSNLRDCTRPVYCVVFIMTLCKTRIISIILQYLS